METTEKKATQNYDFDELIPRRHSHSYKWDAAAEEDVLPMWVADMDFRTAPVILDALRKRVEHGIFGYTKVPDEYYQSLSGWFGRQHGWPIKREWVIYTSGVVPALSAIIKALTVPRDKVVIQTPVYNCFFSSIRNNGCETVTAPLTYADQTYRIDFKAFESIVSDPKVKLFILCNPHNPAGRVWTKEELMRLGEICLRHQVWVIADEIHCELVFQGHTYIPFASLSEEFLTHSITCNSPSKAFNIAGLQIANIVAADPEARAKIDKAINVNEVCEVNPFGVEALMAAYTPEGNQWLNDLKNYLWDNYTYLCDFFARQLPQFPVTRLEGTYLVWVDCSVLKQDSEKIAQRLLEQTKVWVNEGSMYGEAGKPFIRINIACPRKRLAEGLERIRQGLTNEK